LRRRAAACSLLLLLSGAGCGLARLEQREAPTVPFDAVIVPGCPSHDDGRPSRCQVGRALWAAILWERGWATRFITSGSDVHSPYVEAEAIAQVMTTLGVPADRIWLERDALHTDENMYYSLAIAQMLGARHIAVASTRGHALWGCRMLNDWGRRCRALSLDRAAVRDRRRRAPLGALEALRAPASSAWTPLTARERALAQLTGRRRPPSWILYPTLALMRLSGEAWVPAMPRPPRLVTWAERLGGDAEMAREGPLAGTP
jgi:hypothetical protein